MASSDETWKTSLSALDRYEVIQKLQSIHPNSGNDAIAIEQKAFDTSASRAQYDAACSTSTQAALTTSSTAAHTDSPPFEAPQDTIQTGISIGTYQDCISIAEGVTSEVYMSSSPSSTPSAVALKVIVTYRNIEPHNPHREAKILADLRPPCIPLLETFRDREQRLVLVFPYMPMTLAGVLEKGGLDRDSVRRVFGDVLRALKDIHEKGIIHRDVKPSAILLESPNGPAYLSDFGTAWHPSLSVSSEPPTSRILDIGTGPYRAPEVLFGDTSYSTAVDMWSLGVTLSEALSSAIPAAPIFESRPAHEDGSQLGLILSIFKTMGTPTKEVWPEAEGFLVSPFELWTVFKGKTWEDMLPGVEEEWRDAVASMVTFGGTRATAAQVCLPSSHSSRC